MTTATTRMRRPRNRSRLEISIEAEARLKKIMPKSLAGTRTDALHRALYIYCNLIEHQENGWSVVLKKGTEEKPFPIN